MAMMSFGNRRSDTSPVPAARAAVGMSDTSQSTLETLIVARPAWGVPDIIDLWRNRELIGILTWRDISVRYKQALLGLTWAVIQPVVTMVVFSVIFGGVAKVPSDGVAYPLFSIAALVPWQLFANSIQRGSMSLVGNSSLLTKVYFPRLAMPLSSVLSSLVDFVVAAGVMAVVMLFYRVHVGVGVILIIPFTLLALMVSLAMAIWLSAINVLYRDVQHAVPFLLQVLLYLSPVAYSSRSVPSGWLRVLYSMNPMDGVIQGFRWALLGVPANPSAVATSVVLSALGLVSGLIYFRRVERVFADVV